MRTDRTIPRRGLPIRFVTICSMSSGEVCLDLHHRGHDEPPGNGGFLTNAGRIYLDMGHLEYASPECHSLMDVVASDRAGDLLLQRAIEALGFGEHVSFIKNNIDHETDATFGSHENYLVLDDSPFPDEGWPARDVSW